MCLLAYLYFSNLIISSFHIHKSLNRVLLIVCLRCCGLESFRLLLLLFLSSLLTFLDRVDSDWWLVNWWGVRLLLIIGLVRGLLVLWHGLLSNDVDLRLNLLDLHFELLELSIEIWDVLFHLHHGVVRGFGTTDTGRFGARFHFCHAYAWSQLSNRGACLLDLLGE